MICEKVIIGEIDWPFIPGIVLLIFIGKRLFKLVFQKDHISPLFTFESTRRIRFTTEPRLYQIDPSTSQVNQLPRRCFRSLVFAHDCVCKLLQNSVIELWTKSIRNYRPEKMVDSFELTVYSLSGRWVVSFRLF